MTEPTPVPPADDLVIARAMRWSLLVLVVAGAAIVIAILLRKPAPAPPPAIERTPTVTPTPAPTVTPPLLGFTEITSDAGIDFTHFNAASADRLLPETMGGGAAFLDFDDDGDQDVLLANGGAWADRGGRSDGPSPALYANQGDGIFRDVSAEVGLTAALPGTGVACGDYDADGRVDVYLTAVGSNRLLRNTPDGFVDVTLASGTAGSPETWSTSAGFLDSDGDGDLDLFVCNYVAWSRAIDLELDFTLNGTDRAYGPPTNFQGTFCTLYRNDGYRFVDVSTASGIEVTNPATGAPMGKALAATFVDVDDDGHLDILVANDTVQNFLFRNRGDGTFEEIGARSGLAFDGMGNATGAMGMDVVALGAARALAVGIGNFGNEKTSLYVQQRDRWQFADMADALGVGAASRLRLSFGLFFFDADLDGRPDLLQANGHLDDRISEIQPSQHYRQPAQLFWNAGGAGLGRFVEVPAETLGGLTRPLVGRGATYADIDADGDLDVLLTECGGPPLLARNDQQLGHHWLRVRLIGGGSNRDAIGAWVEVQAGPSVQRQQVMPTRSYLSQVELPLTFGLGDAARIDRLEVHWPDGSSRIVDVPAVDRMITVRQAE